MRMDATSKMRSTSVCRSRPRTRPGKSSPAGLRIRATLHARKDDGALSERGLEAVQDRIGTQDGPLRKL
eukprot:4225559-Amphidinium_carterae.1